VALFLAESEVESLVTMADAMAAAESCFRNLGSGQATHEPRRRVRTSAGILHVMFAADQEFQVAGLKSYTTVRGIARFHVLLYDMRDGGLLAMVEADRLGRLRTGAASGVASRLLAPQGCSIAAVIGAGRQAWTQVEALAHAFRLDEIRVFSRDSERRAAFCSEVAARLGLWALPAESAEQAMEGAHVVTTITSSGRPVFPAEAVSPGMHINAAGSNSLLKCEIPEETAVRADVVVVDSRAAVHLESGDLLGPLQKGMLYPEALVELGEVAAGRHPGRTAPEQVTLFKSHGIAPLDVSLAVQVYRRAVERKVGATLGGT
jgi:alanine dehydrogenase